MKILAEKLIAKSLKLNPWTGLNELDYKIAKFLPHLLNKDTFFIEVGANDGIKQSNTYFLESIYGARGLLIEASPSNFEKCTRNRSNKNIFEHCALVSPTFKLPYLKLIYSDLMTVSLESVDVEPIGHAKDGLKFFKGINYEFLSPARTFADILEKNNIKKVDFLSIDIEGGELAALKGIDFESVIIENILIESRNIEEINDYLSKYNFSQIKKLTHHDYLFIKNKD